MTATAHLADDDDWRNQAACRDQDPELFFPTGTGGPAALQTEQAKAVCRPCPVSEACLAWALDTGQDFGIWSGTTEEERRATKRRQAKAAARPDKPDPVAAYRALAGDPDARAQLTEASRREAVRIGLARGMPVYAIARRLNTSYGALKAIAADVTAEQETGATRG